jgi:hypothetical protein
MHQDWDEPPSDAIEAMQLAQAVQPDRVGLAGAGVRGPAGRSAWWLPTGPRFGC